MKKLNIKALFMVLIAAIALVGCGSGANTDGGNNDEKTVVMVADVGGVNDQSYNQGAWEGLQNLTKNTGIKTSFIETVQMSDLDTNFDSAVDGDHELIWGIGFNTANPIVKSAQMNPNLKYAIVDYVIDAADAPNVTSAMFQIEQASFLAGYIAGMTTETNKVAYVGGQKSPAMDKFEYGFAAGAKYAAKELGKDIVVTVQIAETFSDAAKGKAIAASLYNDGHDVIFQAAGAAGTGVIEQAVEENKWVVGVDRDQSYLAPKNMLTSALKNVGLVTEDLSKRILDGEDLAGKVIEYGVHNGGVGIPTENPNISSELYEKTMEVEALIKDGTIVVPADQEAYDAFIK
ncbi:MAG: BMP family ABC transporter substrate-binding protein [Erysipelothrix sp.]|nr:BMP family ABC transporter substrate-binding protein [Erysipelothrix sp.]